MNTLKNIAADILGVLCRAFFAFLVVYAFGHFGGVYETESTVNVHAPIGGMTIKSFISLLVFTLLSTISLLWILFGPIHKNNKSEAQP